METYAHSSAPANSVSTVEDEKYWLLSKPENCSTSKSSESEGAYQSENPYRLEFWQAMAQFTAVSPQFVLRDTIFGVLNLPAYGKSRSHL